MKNIVDVFENAVDTVCKNMDFKNWWKQEFATDYSFKDEDELLSHSKEDMDNIVLDWIYSVQDDVARRSLELIGLNWIDEVDTTLEQEFKASLYEYVRETMKTLLDEQYFLEIAYIHIDKNIRECLERLLNMTGKEINAQTGFSTNGEPLTWTAYFNDGVEADIKLVFGTEEETPCMVGNLICNEQEVCTNNYSDYFGTWEFYYQNKFYIVYFDETKETWFNQIIDKCNDMLADEFYEFSEFGLTGDLTLLIRKDSDYNPDVDKDENNMVFIVTKRNGVAVDDSGNIHVTDLWNTLYRIWFGLEFSTL